MVAVVKEDPVKYSTNWIGIKASQSLVVGMIVVAMAKKDITGNITNGTCSRGRIFVILTNDTRRRVQSSRFVASLKMWMMLSQPIDPTQSIYLNAEIKQPSENGPVVNPQILLSQAILIV